MSTEPLALDPAAVTVLLGDLDALAATWRRRARLHPAGYMAGVSVCADQLAETLTRARTLARPPMEGDPR